MRTRAQGHERKLAGVVIIGAIALASTPAWAQRFPAEEFWVPLRCKGGVIVDPHRDQSGANDERDIVGDAERPAGHRSADADHLFLRMRVDVDPAPRGDPRPFAWRVLLDTDGDNRTYEVLIAAAGTGAGRRVTIYRNTETAVPDDVTDPPDEPAVASYPFSEKARSVEAPGSSWGAGPDYFLEFAVPWRDLEPLGVTPTSVVGAWLTTSSSPNGWNGDFACHDGRTGTPTFSETAPDKIVLDPFVDSDGDGFTDQTEFDNGSNPTEPESFPTPDGRPDALLLRGGAGCAAAASLMPLGAAWLALAGAGLLRRRAKGPR